MTTTAMTTPPAHIHAPVNPPAASPPQFVEPAESPESLPPILNWFDPSLLIPRLAWIRWRARLRFRRRRMRRTMGRPPLRELPGPRPTGPEILAHALARLGEEGEPRKNLVRTMHWMAGDPAVRRPPERVRRAHVNKAGQLLHEADTELRPYCRVAGIRGRRWRRRGRIAEKHRNYRWTRFPERKSKAVWPVPVPRRRFVLPVSAAGPPGGVILFPGNERKEVLLCLPGGGLRAGWTSSPFPRSLLRAG